MAVVTNTPQSPGLTPPCTHYSDCRSTLALQHTLRTRFPPALCYTQEHRVSYPLGSRGQSQHTGTLSQVHTHIDTQIHADSNTETPHTHRRVYAHGGSERYTHTPGLPHIQTLLANPAPHTAVSPGTMCWPTWQTHTTARPPTSCDLHKAEMPGLSMKAAWHLLRGVRWSGAGSQGETPGLPGGDKHPVIYWAAAL